jgi:CBS domain-containing protein
MNVSDIMRKSIASVAADAPLIDAARLLLETNQRALPVLEAGQLVGIISEGDFLHRVELGIDLPTATWLQSVFGGAKTESYRSRVNSLTVGQVMTKKAVCIDEEASADEVVGLMDKFGVSQLPVTCAGIVVGMISRAEMLAAVERSLRDASDRASVVASGTAR